MPLIYRIDASQGLVTITGDYAEDDDWRGLLAAVSSDPSYQRGYGFLRDLRGAVHPVDADVVVRIIDVVREFWPSLGVRRAAIVSRPGVDVPAVIAHALAEAAHLPLRAFTSYEDAVRWLREG